MNKKTKFIFITGGVVSSLGKGLASASLAALLQARGFKVRLRKLDPYLNIDPGTMNPYQHGEVYVTDDGVETDLDLGHYERFTGVPARKEDSITSGKIYADLLAKERRGDYLGRTVQVIPHVTTLIKEFITSNIENEDFILCEIGGTVGDIEGLPFFESIRQLGNEFGKDSVLYIHLTLLPYIRTARELKTKPTQHSVKELRSIGIQPHILLCRSEKEIPKSECEKIALFCNIPVNCVIPALDQKTIYRVPILYHDNGLDERVLELFNVHHAPAPDLSKWFAIVENAENPLYEIDIAIIGKYNKVRDAYKSLIEAFQHAGLANRCHVKLHWINSSLLNPDNINEKLQNMHGIMVPGGFGESGVEGKILAVNYARTRNIPYFGICFGMQLACIEIARNVIGITDATSGEFKKEGTKIIDIMEKWLYNGQLITRSHDSDLGGTMRLGLYQCNLQENTLAHDIYNTIEIKERHRHRYEFNINYKKIFEKHGIIFSGMSPDNMLTEIIELKSHPWFIGVQFHPELLSKPFACHPLFASFVKKILIMLNYS